MDPALPLVINGAVSSASSVNALTLTGLITMNGTNTSLTGPVNLVASTVTVGAAQSLGTGTVGLSGTSRLELAGQALTIGGLSSTDANSVVENNSPTAGVLIVNPLNRTQNNSFAGLFQDGTTNQASLSIRLQNSGILTLTNPNSTISGTAAVGSGTMILSNTGALAVSGSVTIGDQANNPGVLRLDGGTLMASANGGATVYVGSGANAVGALVMNANSIATFANELYFGFGPNASDNTFSSYGGLVMNGGTLTHNSFLGMGRGQAANSAGASVLYMTGGRIDGTAAANPLQIGAYQGTVTQIHGMAVLLGGTIDETGTSGGSGFATGDFTGGVTNMVGGNVVARSMFMGRNGGVGELNLNAGTLTTAQITWGGTAGNIINFNGGLLQAGAGAANLLGNSGNGTAYVWGGGVKIDTNGTTSTFGQALLTPVSNSIGGILFNGGTGYTATPTVQITGGGGSGAAAVALVNTASQTITGIIITNLGQGYTSAPTVAFNGGGGSNATASVTGLTTVMGIGAIATGTANNYSYVAPPMIQIFPASGGGYTGGGVGATAYATIDPTTGTITGMVVTNPGVGYNTIVSGTSQYSPYAMILGGGTNSRSISLTPVAIASDGGLTQNGTGTLTISNSNHTYTGPTTLNGGLMNLTGKILTSPTWNINAGKLNVGGNGAINASSAINVAAGSTLVSAGKITAGTLTTSGFVQAGSIMAITTAVTINSGGLFNANGTVSRGGGQRLGRRCGRRFGRAQRPGDSCQRHHR